MSGSAYLFDTNVWVALAFPSHSQYDKASAVLGAVSEAEPAIFCRSTQQSFLRVATTPTILKAYGAASLTNRDALLCLDRFVAHPRVVYRDEPSGIGAPWHRLASTSKASPKLWMDAYLAAFAIAGRYRFVTFDKGFKQFKSLDLHLLS